MTLEMEAAADVAQRAGKVALSHFSSRIAVETKADGSPVTVADRAAEEVARAWLSDRFPEDGVLGEEMGETRPGAKRRWILDPIDGTRTFVRGVPLWGTLVALAQGEEVLAGAAYFPAVGELLVAAPGQGCFWNGQRTKVSSVTRLCDAAVLTTDERFPQLNARRDAYRKLADEVALSRSWGDCYGYLLVATGRAEAMMDGILSPWDSASLLPIIEEAGGVFTDWDGRRTAFGNSAIATNAALAAPLRERLGARGGPGR
jgi:histidinol phosphatase-like enzyme (inositol monophosphatase family)